MSHFYQTLSILALVVASLLIGTPALAQHDTVIPGRRFAPPFPAFQNTAPPLSQFRATAPPLPAFHNPTPPFPQFRVTTPPFPAFQNTVPPMASFRRTAPPFPRFTDTVPPFYFGGVPTPACWGCYGYWW